MCFEGGIREFVRWANRNKTPVFEDVIYMAGSKGDASAEIAVQYNDGYNEFMRALPTMSARPRAACTRRALRPP